MSCFGWQEKGRTRPRQNLWALLKAWAFHVAQQRSASLYALRIIEVHVLRNEVYVHTLSLFSVV